jgi:hypothetical protein
MVIFRDKRLPRDTVLTLGISKGVEFLIINPAGATAQSLLLRLPLTFF